MAKLVLCALTVLLIGGHCQPKGFLSRKVSPLLCNDPVYLKRQKDFMTLYFHVQEPIQLKEHVEIVKTWRIEDNYNNYYNVTAAKIAVKLLKRNRILPKGVPFSINDSSYKFETTTYFNVLHSAKDFGTFYNTAVLLRNYLNEYLFVYVLSAAVYHRHEEPMFFIPPLYEVFPSFFHNGDIMTTAFRIATHRDRLVEHYPMTYVKDGSVIIISNASWIFNNPTSPIDYFTNDYALNEFYYNTHLSYPNWIGGETCRLIKDQRGSWLWFAHKQILARYYLERLSNGLGEIPELELDIVEEGFMPGLNYLNGISFSTRPNYFSLKQPLLVNTVAEIIAIERRIEDAIDMGYIIASSGEHIDIRNPEAMDILGRVVEASVDSPNIGYYKDFITMWKTVLGNSIVHNHYKGEIPLFVPSALEQYQTALRDPAFFIIWKRILGLFAKWQAKLPLYTQEELGMPGVAIQNVKVGEIITYFDKTYTNVTFHIYRNEYERANFFDNKSILVEYPRLNHREFTINVTVASEKSQACLVRFFLAPKYDSRGREIPLHINTQNFFLFDRFTYFLEKGGNVIEYKSTSNLYTTKDFRTTAEVYKSVVDQLNGHGQYYIDLKERVLGFPHRLHMPKGTTGGMPFILMAYVSPHREPSLPFGSAYKPDLTLGLGTGARHITSDPLGYPLDRPLHQWQVEDIKNMKIVDVVIRHK